MAWRTWRHGLLLILCTVTATERHPRFSRGVGCPPDTCRRLASVTSLRAIQPARKLPGSDFRPVSGQVTLWVVAKSSLEHGGRFSIKQATTCFSRWRA